MCARGQPGDGQRSADNMEDARRLVKLEIGSGNVTTASATAGQERAWNEAVAKVTHAFSSCPSSNSICGNRATLGFGSVAVDAGATTTTTIFCFFFTYISSMIYGPKAIAVD